MFATDFPESNHIIDKPPNMTRDECEPLNVFIGKDTANNNIIISCWKPTKEELEEINSTGRIWCYHFGQSLQPHSLSGENPFIRKEAP